jgi:hypothetical protein
LGGGGGGSGGCDDVSVSNVAGERGSASDKKTPLALSLPDSTIIYFKKADTACHYCGKTSCPGRDVGTKHKNFQMLPRIPDGGISIADVKKKMATKP